MPSPKYSDVIFATRFGYNHYGIYIGNQKVIHYCKEESDNLIDDIKNTITCNGIIGETTLDVFLHGGNLYICHFEESRIKKILDSDLLSTTATVLGGPLGWGLKLATNLLDTDTEVVRSAKKIYSPDETVLRAAACRDTRNYNLVFHNCEHFAIWCKTGVSSSVQVKKIIKLITHVPC